MMIILSYARIMMLTIFLLTCQGWNGWKTDADVPWDPNTNRPVEWRIQMVSNFSHSGRASLMFFLDGSQDDGTIWIEKFLWLKTSYITISFWFWSSEKSEAVFCDVVAYVGVDNPSCEEQFTAIGPANQVAGWKQYSYSVHVPASKVWVAIGINVFWETRVCYYIDDIQILPFSDNTI